MKIQTSPKLPYSSYLSILGLAFLAGCGGDGGDQAPAPAQPPYSQQSPYSNGQFRTPIESGSRSRCAVDFPRPKGGAIDPLPVVDGGQGWSRLVAVDQYEEDSNGYGSSRFTGGKTTIRYHDSGNQYRDGRPNAEIRSNETCSSQRRMGGVNLSVIEVPLAIHRISGEVLQSLVLNVGGTSRARLEELAWEVRDTAQTRGRWGVPQFLSNMQSNGYSVMTSGRLPNGDTEIFLGTAPNYANGQMNGKFVRVVYRPDAPAYGEDEDQTNDVFGDGW
jgi:hypothetical protein